MGLFYKYQGLGNSYIVVRESEAMDFGALARSLCDVRFGIGSDGLLVRTRDQEPFRLRIFNPDGSEAEKSGNGIRIYAKYLWETRSVAASEFNLYTMGGVVQCQISRDGGLVTVDMGELKFEPKDIPIRWNESKNKKQGLRQFLNEEIEVGGRVLKVSCASIGNPHCVILGKNWKPEEVLELGPLVENYPLFPNRTNVQFVEVLDRKNLSILIWERGAGFTLSSGSSSSAAAGVCFKLGLIEGEVSVQMPGGKLSVSCQPDFRMQIAGPVKLICKGEYYWDPSGDGSQ